MGASWLPDPPIGQSSNEISTVSSPSVMFMDSDTDDQEHNLTDENSLENNGYRLLGTFDNHADDDQEDTEEDSAESVLCSVQTSLDTSSSDNGVDVLSSSSTVLESNPPDNVDVRDIEIDCEQVRAIMAQITLPPSAAPSWASTVPDSEWCTFLQNRMRILQGRNEEIPEFSELKNRRDCG